MVVSRVALSLFVLLGVISSGQVGQQQAEVSLPNPIRPETRPVGVTPWKGLPPRTHLTRSNGMTRPNADPSGSLNASSIFREAPEYNSGGEDALSIAVADVNGDGKPDLLVAHDCASSSSCTNGVVGVLLGNGDGTFQPAVTYSSGGYSAFSVAVADVNGDGKPDLLVANQCAINNNCSNGGGVGVLLGNGDGTFQAAVSYDSGGEDAVSIAVADVNGDGKPDLLMANQCIDSSCTNGSVGVLLGNGDGTFQAAVSYDSSGQFAYSMAVADVNGDGKPDLLVANLCAGSSCTNGGEVGVLLGNGDGTFQAAVSYNSGGAYALSIAVADVNGDGKPDLLVANQCVSSGNCANGGVGVLLGNGDGTFQAAVSYNSGGENAYSVAVADVNGDGKLDLLVADYCNGNCASGGGAGALLGNGDGTFQPAVSYNSGGGDAFSVAVADVNGDGKPDLLVANECAISSNCASGGAAGVLLGNGDGTFQAAVNDNSGGAYAYSIAVADVNGDGKPDLLVANQCANSNCTNGGGVGVLLGNGDGTFQAAANYNSDGDDAYSIAVADVNGDGYPDLLVANYCVSISSCMTGGVGVLLGNGDGTFQAAVSYDSGGEGVYSIAVVDVNGDGHPDLLVSNQCVSSGNCTNGGVGVLLGNGDGTFQAAVTYSSGGADALSIAVADVNGDGKPDLLVANQCVSSSNCTNGVVGVLLGNGDGTFQPAVTYSSGGYSAFSIAVADVNGDGKPDLLLANQCAISSCTNGGGVGVLLGNGDGTFQAPQTTATPSTLFHGQIAVADFNSDGKLDLAIGSGSVLLLGNGDGTFQTPLNLGAGDPGIAVGDFNGDGSPDLAVGGVTILMNLIPALQSTTTTLSSSANPSAYGQSTSFSASVQSNGSTPQGTMIFMDGTNLLTTVTLLNGSASFATSGLSVGTHSITASYSGDSHHMASTGSLSQVVNTASTMTTVLSSVNPSAYAQAVVFAITVMPSYSGVPSGTVTISNGGIVIGTAMLQHGATTFSTSALSLGSNSISASYSGDANFQSSTSGALVQVVNQAATTTTLTPDANPSYVGYSVVLTANVISQYGAPVTGNVTFRLGTTVLNSVAVSNGTASYTTTPYTTTGTRPFTATYSGDSNNQGGASAVLKEVVDAFPATTKTVVAASANSSLVNQSVTFTAETTWSLGPVPNGEVINFFDGATQIGTAATSLSVASFTTSALSAGTHNIKAVFVGDTNFKSSNGTVKHVVNKYPSSTSLSSSLNPSNFGQSVTFSAMVTSAGSVTPTGTVTFKNGTTNLGAVTLNSGMATLSTTKLAVGTNNITASYNGDPSNGKSTSSVLMQTVNQAQITLSLTSSPNPSTSGQNVKFTAMLTSNGSLPGGTITFSYNGTALGTGNLSGGKAIFSSKTLPVGNDTVTATFTGNTDYSSASASIAQSVN